MCMGDMKNALTQVSSVTHEHINNTTEHVVQEFLDFRGITVINMDLTNIANTLIITVQEMIDGTNYRIKSSKSFPADFEADVETVVVTMEGSGNDLKLTIRSPGAEGSDKDVFLTLRETIVL